MKKKSFNLKILKSKFFTLPLKYFKKFFTFFYNHKIFSSLLTIIILISFLIIKIILGPFGFLGMNLFSLSGFLGEKNYLVLLQNENELRPTGGFITSFAKVKMNFGKLSLEVFDSISVAPPQEYQKAPRAIEEAFVKDEKFRGWVFHDSNFNLDFRKNAEKALFFLKKDSRFFGVEFDGVFAVDLTAIEKLIDIFGPLQIEDKTINSENLFSIMQRQAKDFDLHNEEEWKTRKKIFTPLAQKLMQEIITSPFLWDDFFEALGNLADKKHFLLAFVNDQLQNEILTKNWSGALPSKDFFSINIANLGGRKADRFMKRNYFSTFYIDENKNIQEDFELRLAHEGTYNLQSDRYKAFIRIQRPKGTKIIKTSDNLKGEIQKKDFDHYSEFSYFLTLLPNERKTFNFNFMLPHEASLEESNNFYFFKQPGIFDQRWEIVFKGANDLSFQSNDCNYSKKAENVFFCDLVLSQDQEINLTLKPDQLSPIMQWINLINLNELELRFSEKISSKITVKDIKIIDLNQKNNTLDNIKIEKVQIDNLAIKINFSGMSEQKGEFFRIFIKDVQDISGNLTSKNPFYATFKQ